MSVEANAFAECRKLEKVTISEGVTSIHWGAFSNCSKLTDVSLPDSLNHIGSGAFFGCKKLESLTIPESVTHIENNIVVSEKDCADDEENENESQTSGLIKLNNKDKLKIKNILKREYFNNNENWINSHNPNNEIILTNLAIIKNELIQMENSDYKAEGEYLVSKYFSDFLYLVEQSII